MPSADGDVNTEFEKDGRERFKTTVNSVWGQVNAASCGMTYSNPTVGKTVVPGQVLRTLVKPSVPSRGSLPYQFSPQGSQSMGATEYKALADHRVHVHAQAQRPTRNTDLVYLLDPLRAATISFSETNRSICAPSASPYFAFSSLRARSDVLRLLTWSRRAWCEAVRVMSCYSAREADRGTDIPMSSLTVASSVEVRRVEGLRNVALCRNRSVLWAVGSH